MVFSLGKSIKNQISTGFANGTRAIIRSNAFQASNTGPKAFVFGPPRSSSCSLLVLRVLFERALAFLTWPDRFLGAPLWCSPCNPYSTSFKNRRCALEALGLHKFAPTEYILSWKSLLWRLQTVAKIVVVWDTLQTPDFGVSWLRLGPQFGPF